MCPNCFPSLGISPGYIVAFFVCILFFGVGLVAMIAANRSGRMTGLEETKYSMLED
jgi:hypothetical protein